MKTLAGRTLPVHTMFYFDLAERLNLSCPMGRALYMINRNRNCAGTVPDFLEKYPSMKHLAEYLPEAWEKAIRKVRHDTAVRWLAHFKAGGSIRLISMTHQQELARRRVQDKDRRKRDKERAK